MLAYWCASPVINADCPAGSPELAGYGFGAWEDVMQIEVGPARRPGSATIIYDGLLIATMFRSIRLAALH
jgi:hypothetical protein